MSDLPNNKLPRRKPKIDWDTLWEIIGIIAIGAVFLFLVWVAVFAAPARNAAQEAKTIRAAEERVLDACGSEGLRKFKIVNGGTDINEYDYEDESRATAAKCLGINRDTSP